MPRSARPALLTAALLCAAGALAGCSTTPASSLELGACYQGDRTDDSGAVTRVGTVDCSAEHTSEVVGVIDLPAGDFPGRDALIRRASDDCPSEFEEYTGRPYAEAGETLTPLLPDEQGWEAGDHRILCIAHTDEPATGSIAAP